MKSGAFCAGRRGRRPLRSKGKRGANSPECGKDSCGSAGRFVKGPYIRFSKLRVRRQILVFQVRLARVVEDADPYERSVPKRNR